MTAIEQWANDRTINKRSIQFGDIRRYHNIDSWPFYYPFISYPYMATDDARNPTGLLGVTIAVGQIFEMNIVTQRDTPYFMTGIKYTVFGDQVQGGFTYAAQPGGGWTRVPSAIYHVHPWFKYLWVSLSISSVAGNYVYGGNQHTTLMGQTVPRFQVFPEDVMSLQGFDDGFGWVEIPALLPAEATIKIQMVNLWDHAIYVNGMVAGYKCAV